MSDFRFEVLDEGDKVQFHFFGSLKEKAQLPELEPYKGKEIHLDLQEMAFINSIGIRTWIVWVDKFKAYSFIFRNVPTTVVDQINLVVGFLPAISRVDSLYVPFECETCDVELKILFNNETDFLWKDGQVHLLKSNLTCPTCSDPIELSTSEQRYFRFLKT